MVVRSIRDGPTTFRITARPSESGLSRAVQQIIMPATLEVVCTDDDCELDMFELHYTYDMPDEVGLTDFQCPYCGGVDCLQEVEL